MDTSSHYYEAPWTEDEKLVNRLASKRISITNRFASKDKHTGIIGHPRSVAIKIAAQQSLEKQWYMDWNLGWFK